MPSWDDMNNAHIARLFYEMADLLDVLGVDWKPLAFRKAARNIEMLQDDLADVFKRGGLPALMEIPGVGDAIAKKILECLLKGTFDELEKTKKKLPGGIIDLMSIRGVGPKSVRVLYRELGVRSVTQLEKAARAGKVRKLEGFGVKSEKDILEGISLLRKGQERALLGVALPLARRIETLLRQVKGVEDVVIAGSVRRRKETCKDIDILVVAKDSAAVMEAFTTMPDVVKIEGKGPTKSSVVLDDGLGADLRVVPAKSMGAALQYFTGNKDHNVRLRQIALKQGLTLNEYGLFTLNGRKYVCGTTEEGIYKRLGIPFVPPEIRENSGEFDVKKAPALIPYDALKGDLHMHTFWSDGIGSPQDMLAAASRLGYDYIAITDHSKSEFQAHGMDEKRLLQYVRELRALSDKSGIRLFVGSEVDIKKDGSLDYSDRFLKELDIVVAAVHSGFTMDEKTMTTRLLKALGNPHVTVLGHPTGRLINGREPFAFDHGKVFQAAKDNGVALEVNGHPVRLDLNDVLVRKAREIGCSFVIDSDAHHPDSLAHAEYGIATARRGWLDAKHVLNTLPRKRFEKAIGL